MAVKWIIAVIALTLTGVVQSSHFRGGIIQWRPLNAQNFDGRIEVNHRIAWRRSCCNHGCTNADIGTTRLFGSGTLSCRSGCSGDVGSLDFYCTSFDTTEDWIAGERTYTYNIGTSVTNFEASYASCCWISLVVGGAPPWEIRVKGNLAPRSDNGLINSSPVTTSTPIVRLQSGCTHIYRIPVQDADQDTVRCRWATGNECAGVCGTVPGAVVDQNACTITWTPTTTGWYGAALQIEDFISSSSSTPMSSVPLQFLFNVFSNSQPCTGGIRPSLVAGETPPDNSCIPVPFGTTYMAGLVASSGGTSVSITRFITSAPFGLRTSSVTQSPFNSTLYYTNVTWTPTTSQFGLQQFCFRAASSNGLESGQSCITLLGGVTGPSALGSSVSPMGRFSPSASTTWSITFDQAITRPSSSRYIRFYETASRRNVYNFDVTSAAANFPSSGTNGRTITFSFSASFTAGLAHYILLDSGVAVGTEFCNQESLAVTSTTFWSFTTGCPVGFEDSGGTCVDINECTRGTFTCPTNAVCMNTIGSYTCPCAAGYEMSGSSCIDINECSRGTDQCHPAATCTNTAGSYTCTCPTGSMGDGRTCTDLCNECTGTPTGCGTHNCNVTTSDCTNTIGSFQCTCRFGLASNGVSCAPPPRPDPPSGVSPSFIGTTSCTIVWTAPVPSVGNRISGYTLVLTEVGGGGGIITITTTGTGTTYTFTGLQEYRTYTCVITAISIYGPISVSTPPITIMTLEAAPSAPPTSFVATPSDSRSATVTWGPPPDDDLNGVIIRYIINVTVVGTGQSFQLTSTTTSLTVTTLTPYTTFICIIAAVTSVGIGPFSAQFTLITPQDAPTSPPRSVVLAPVSSTSISLTWAPPPAADINGVIVEYRINITEVATGRVFTLTSSTTSLTAQGLHPFYVYECVVSAFTVAIGPYSQVFRITTPEDVPSGSPLNFGGSASTSRSATISWSPPRADLQNGVIIRYIINVTVVETGQSFQLTSTTTSLTVTTLTPYRNFICIIAAVTSVGIGPFSTQFTLTTPQDVPTSAPVSPTAVVRNSRAIFCSWSPPPVQDHNGIIVEYRINITEVITGRVFVRVSTGTSLEVTGLHPDYVYQWIVTAVTVGAGPYTVVSTIRTPEDVPNGPPASSTAVGLTATSIQITWQPPALPDQNGVITGYVIIVTSLETTISQQFVTNSTSLTVPNLDAFSNYVCIVAATTAVGRGPFSAVINVQTLETAPGSHPSNFTGMSLNSTHLYLTWDPPPPSQVNGIIREYRLNITEAATGVLLQFTTDADERELVVGDLHPYYIYHCSVVAYTILPGPVTSTFTIQTEEDIPTGPPTSLVASTVDPQTISLSWAPPLMDQQNGILRYYIITLTSSGLPTVTRNISASLLSLNITGLRAYTQYSCIVEVGTVGLSPPTAPQVIRTPEDAPSGPPRTLNLTINDSRSLVLTWEVPLPQDVNGIVTDYTINISSALGSRLVLVGSNVTVFTLTSLSPYVAYTCVVAAHTSAGRGPFSGGVTLTTPEDVPEAPPIMISHSNVQSRSVDLAWMAPRSDRQNGVIRYYVIEVYENATGNVLTYQTPSAQTSFTVNNLHPYYRYSIRIGAVTTAPGPLSTYYSIFTAQDIPTAAPINPSGAAVPETSTLINLRWSPVPAEHLNGELLFYLVEVTEVITNNSWTFHAVLTHINIGPLHSYYTYRCRLAAFTVGVGPFTPFFYVNSGENYPTGAPLNLTAPRTTTNSLSLSWDPPRFDQQNGIIRYYVVYLLDVTSNSSWTVTSNTTRVTVSNLQPFFTYNCSVAAFTIGEGPVSSELSVTLPQTAPSVAPTNVRGLAIDHSSISLEWDAPPTLLLNGILSRYVVNVTERETGRTFEVNTTTTSVILGSLHPDYVYECRVAAFTIAPGPFSTIFAVQVLMSAPSAAPENITATAITATQILVSWDLPPPEHRNGPILAYNFTATDTSTGLVVSSAILQTRSSLVSSLRPFTLYNFTLSARTSVGYGPSGSAVETTLQDTPSTPTNLIVQTVDGDPYSLYVTWAPPTTPNGYITSYNVYCQDSQTMVGSGGGPVMSLLPILSTFTTSTADGDTLNATVTGLTPFSSYGCYVSANTSIGEGDSSDPVFQTTDEFVPADAPASLQVSVLNASSVSLSWSPPLTPYGIIVSYTILAQPDSNYSTNTTTIVVGPVSSAIVEELLPNTNYNFSVAAATRVGTGPYAGVTAMTPEGSPYGSPRSVSSQVTGTTSANVSWIPPDASLQNGLITYYTVVLVDVTFGTPDRVYNTTLTSFSFTGLEEYGRYSCQVAAGTVGGLGPVSNGITFVTFEDVPTAPPQNITATALSSNLVMFFWSPPPPLDVNGVIRYYTVEVVERHTGRQWTFFAVDADLHVGSLHPYYFYDFNVSATTVGMGPFSSQYTVLTLPEAPVAAPEQLSLATKTSTSLTLQWNPPPFEDTNGPIQYYVVRLRELDTNTTLASRNTFTRQITFNQLHPYYVYQATLAAYTVGIGPYTLPITVQLEQEAPSGAPLNVRGTSLDPNSISLSWSPPLLSERNGAVQHYLVNVTELDTGLEVGHVSLSTNFTLFALHPYYSYSIRVTAVTVAAGPAASPVVIRTNEDVPTGPAQNLNATVLSSDMVLITWEDPESEDVNGVITGYVINVTDSSGQRFQTTSTSRSLLLDELSPFTVYTCLVAARTSVGVGPFSLALSFTTDEAAPSDAPLNISIFATSPSSISLSWAPPALADRNGIITEYRLNLTELDTGMEQLLTSLTTSYVIQGLHPYYMYLILVSAHTVDTGPYSEAQVIQTPEDVPSGFPQMLRGNISSSRSVTLSWVAPPEEQQNGEITSYSLNITDTRTGVTIQRTVSNSQTTLTVTSLSPFTSYSCLIAASTSVGLGPFSTVLTLTTLEDSPDMSPANLTGLAQDSTTILLRWDQPSGAHNGIIREYRVNLTEQETGVVTQLTSATTDLLVGNLHPDYTYQWTVTAFTVAEGPYSITSSVRTLEDVPSGPPTNAISSPLTSSSILLNWALPLQSQRNGAITGYVINITNLDTEMTQQHVTGLVSNLTITDLSPFTVYVATIAARTAVGVGPFSGVFSSQTLEDAPGSHPLNSTGYALNSTHIFLDWSPPLEANGIIREYRINVTEGETNTLQRLTTDNGTTEIVVGPLHPFYTYHCTILAFTVEGGPNTTVISIRTQQDVPTGPPTNVLVTPTSTRSISLSWSPPRRELQNGIITHYLVTVSSAVTGTISTRNVSSVQQTVSISGLSPYTVYNCTVQAETVGLGPASDVVVVSTPQDVPTGSPKNVTAQVLDPTSLTLSWAPPLTERTNGLIQRYHVRITELETGQVRELNVTETSVVVSGLHPFYQYRYIVAAVTVGVGPYSVASLVRLPEAPPSSSPENVQISEVTATSFLLSWSAPADVDQNGLIRSYTLNVTELNTETWRLLTTSSNSQRLQSLHPYYNYTCVVSAVTVEAGPYSLPVTITTAESVPAGPPLNLQGRATSPTSVLLMWDPPATHLSNGLITRYTVTQVSAGTTTTSLTTTDLMLTVTGLRPFTSYSFTVTASTSVGSGPASPSEPIMTPEDAPDGAVTNLLSSNVTSTSLTLSWLPPQNTQQNGVIRHYLIRAQELETGLNTTYQAQSHLMFSIGDLHPYYMYMFVVFAVTVETGPPSLDHTVRTLQDVPSASPESTNASAVDSRTLQVSWTPPPASGQNGVITAYVVNISVTETGEQFQRTATGSASSSLTIASLHPDYTYTYRVAASTSVGLGPFSSFRSIRMPEDVPESPPLNTTGRAVNSTAIQFTWEHPTPSSRNGNITGYSLIVTELVTGISSTYRPLGAHLELVVGSLHPFYLYQCVIAAETRVGRGPYGQPFNTSTLADVPDGAPLNVVATAVTSRSILVSWEPPETDQQNGVIQHYMLVVRETETSSSLSYTSRTTSFTVSDLHPAYTYTVEVAAVTVGVGPFTTAPAVLTPDDVPTGTPQGIRAVFVSSTSITISWQAPLLELQNGDITSYHISVLELETNIVRNFTAVPTDSIYVVNSLHPFYSYNCSVAAYTNGLGPSDHFTVQTLQEEPSEPPRNVSVTATNATAVIVTWLPPLPEHRNGIILSYSLRVVGTHTGDDLTFTVSSTSIVVPSLHPFYDYRFTVAAVTIAQGPFSDPESVMMPPLAPSQEVSNITVDALSPTSLSLRWLPASQDEWNGIISRYTIEYRLLRQVVEDEDGDEEEEEDNGLSDEFLMTFVTYAPSSGRPLLNNPDPRRARTFPLLWEEREIVGLQEYFVYSVSVYYENSAGRSESSGAVELSMPPAAPTGPPTGVSVTSLSENIIVIQWSPPDLFERNGPITAYETSLIYRNGTRRVHTTSGSTFILQIEGLPKFATINVTVAARTTVGIGPSSLPVSVNTSGGLPEAPGAVKAEILDKINVMLSWSALEGVLLDYQIIYYGYKDEEIARITKRAVERQILDGPKVITVPPDQTSYLIENLNIDLNYTFIVRARTAAGYGANSTAVTADLSLGRVVVIGPVTGSSSTTTAIIVLAVIGWILLMVVVILIVAVLLWRRRHRYGAFSFITGAKNKRVRDGSSGPVGVHNTNFYEMEGQVKVNPIGGMELENPTFELQDEDEGAASEAENRSFKLVFAEDSDEDSASAKVEAAAEAKRRMIEEEAQERRDYDDGGEIVFL